jgi:NADH-quinone oxidoreductase subunit I
MQPSMKLICCVVFFEACPKDAIYLSETFAPANFTRTGFIYGKDHLLIPNPVTEPEAYAAAKGQRN